MDTDGDGELSAAEIHRALSKKNEDVSLARVKELVAKADTDGNGLVSPQFRRGRCCRAGNLGLAGPAVHRR